MSAARIKYLLQQYAGSGLSGDEISELVTILRQQDASLEVPLVLQQMLEEAPDDKLIRTQNWQPLLAKIVAVDKPVTINKFADQIQFLKTTWFRYAAAVILVFGAIAYFMLNNKKTQQSLTTSSNHFQTDIMPGRDRAVLTLANGQQILLDSTQGNIVKHGSLTIVNLAGRLKYEGVGTSVEYNTISTPKGGQYQIVLSDGSNIWLNAASSIKFPTAFIGSTRQVEVKGEAYMEIARNTKQSFVVKVNSTEIQVLGTSFNINAYEDEPAVKTTLISGSVKVINSSRGIILKPGQQAVVNHTNQHPANSKIPEILIQTANIEQILAWKNGVFQFNQANLEDVMKQLARWYDVEVVYEKGIPNIQLDGKIKRDLTLPQILDGLGGEVKFRIEGKRLIVL